MSFNNRLFRNYLQILALVLVLAGCSQKETGPMYVLRIDNAEDAPVLRAASRNLTPRELRSGRTRTLLERMLATVTDPSQDGVGIAAPQVGENLRIIWVQRLDKPGEPFECYLNAHIDSLYGEIKVGPEGCLSIPPYRGEVARWQDLILSYVSPETLLPARDTVHGFTAVIFQHECDHLDGILYIDRADTVYIDPVWQAELEAMK